MIRSVVHEATIWASFLALIAGAYSIHHHMGSCSMLVLGVWIERINRRAP